MLVIKSGTKLWIHWGTTASAERWAKRMDLPSYTIYRTHELLRKRKKRKDSFEEQERLLSI